MVVAQGGEAMRRREFLAAAGTLALSRLVRAQQSTRGTFTIGILTTPGVTGTSPAFVEALAKLGYQQGQNLTILFRAAKTTNAELPALAQEMVGLKPDVMVAATTPPALALKDATATIPIVMIGVGDPVTTGLVRSLARPGGNITGTANAVEEWNAKRLQSVTEMLAGLRCLSYLRNPANQSIMAHDTDRKSAGQKLGIEFDVIDVSTPGELDQVLARPLDPHCGRALYLPLDGVFITRRTQIAKYALSEKAALFAAFREDAEAGALMAFGFNLDVQWRLGADYVDRILKGARPADLPLQQPVKFETIINLKTAKALDIQVPTSLLLSADEVIE
jgi:putative ABC transport system substrate-binding protein